MYVYLCIQLLIGISQGVQVHWSDPPLESVELSCLEAELRCEQETHCHKHLSKLYERCPNYDKCPLGYGTECYNFLASLQLNSHFFQCTCDVTNEDCMRMHQFIYSHECLNRVEKSRHDHHKPETIDPQRANEIIKLDLNGNGPVFGSDYDDYSDEVYDTYEMEESESCITARKICLQDETCEGVLTSYRLKCREIKKKNLCDSMDRHGCNAAIETLQELAPALFDCTCNQKRQESRSKCDQIQSRIANNTCLVDVRFYIHTEKPYERSHEQIVRLVKSSIENSGHSNNKAQSGTCAQALLDCVEEDDCNAYLKGFMDACHWTSENLTCHRDACLKAIKDFYLLVRPEKTSDLLLCQCRDSDSVCESVKDVLRPNCALIEKPPPDCHTLVRRCREDTNCKLRYENYVQHCGFASQSSVMCPEAPAMCRSAMKGIQGTVLMANCTCPTEHTHPDFDTCEDARFKLQGYTPCKRDAIEHYFLGRKSELTDNSHQIIQNTIPDRRDECMQIIRKHFPSYVSTPEVIRRYDRNDSDCSEVCSCANNGSLTCVKLACALNGACNMAHMYYSHGSSFNDMGGRGQCRCIRGEMVCARIGDIEIRQAGLYIHIGYSISDKNLIEEHSNMRFNRSRVTSKLATLLNADSAEQFCTLRVLPRFETRSNLVFQVELSRHNSKTDGMSGCLSAAKSLGNKINSRFSSIIMDAELSILKVAQLEQVSIYRDTSSNRDKSQHYDVIDASKDDVIKDDYDDVMAIQPFLSTPAALSSGFEPLTFEFPAFLIFVIEFYIIYVSNII